MVCALLGTIVVGMVLGYMFLDVTAKPMLDETLMAALDFMGFVAGIEIGSNRRLLKQICTPKNLAAGIAHGRGDWQLGRGLCESFPHWLIGIRFDFSGLGPGLVQPFLRCYQHVI